MSKQKPHRGTAGVVRVPYREEQEWRRVRRETKRLHEQQQREQRTPPDEQPGPRSH